MRKPSRSWARSRRRRSRATAFARMPSTVRVVAGAPQRSQRHSIARSTVRAVLRCAIVVLPRAIPDRVAPAGFLAGADDEAEALERRERDVELGGGPVPAEHASDFGPGEAVVG